MKRGRLKSVNHARKDKAWLRNYGEEADLVRLMSCVVPGCSGSPIEVAHNPSRGANGGRFDIGPLCKAHHYEQGTAGILTFQKTHGLDLRELWDEIAILHPLPLGLRFVAINWRSLLHGSYEADALAGWIRRAHHRGLDVRDIADSLDIDEFDVPYLIGQSI